MSIALPKRSQKLTFPAFPGVRGRYVTKAQPVIYICTDFGRGENNMKREVLHKVHSSEGGRDWQRKNI